MAATVRAVFATLSEVLPAQSGEQKFRPAPAPVVRAEPSRRGFRRNIRRMAAAALELAHALCRVAGAQETGICRRADGGNRHAAAAAHPARAGRAALAAHADLGRALPQEAGALCL